MYNLSFKKLFHLLVELDMDTLDLQRKAGITRPTILKLRKNEQIRTDTIYKICAALKCQPGDISEYIDERGNAPKLSIQGISEDLHTGPKITQIFDDDELNDTVQNQRNQTDNISSIDSKKKRGRPSRKIEETQKNQEVETLTEPPKPPEKQPEKISETMASKLFFAIPIDMWESDKINNPWKFEANQKYPLIDPQTGYAYRILPLGQNQIRQE